MIVKKGAIINNIRFTRVLYDITSGQTICNNGRCIHRYSDICRNECRRVYYGRVVNKFGYVVKKNRLDKT